MLQYSADWLPLLTITSNANASRTKKGWQNYDLVVSIIGLFFPQTKPHMASMVLLRSSHIASSGQLWDDARAVALANTHSENTGSVPPGISLLDADRTAKSYVTPGARSRIVDSWRGSPSQPHIQLMSA